MIDDDHAIIAEFLRHMLAAVGSLSINSPIDAPILRQIREMAAYLDALLVAAKQ